MSNLNYTVISDIHLGESSYPNGLGIFSQPHVLAGFIRHFITDKSEELIILGDGIDFLQNDQDHGDNLNCKSAKRTMKKYLKINETVFNAIRDFLRCPNNRLTYVLGNHDIEMAIPDVWDIFADNVDPNKQARKESRFLCLTNGESYEVKINGVQVLMNHGNRADFYNAFDYSELNQAGIQAHQLANVPFSYPSGTRLVYQLINELKLTYPFIDLVKENVDAFVVLVTALGWKELIHDVWDILSNILRARGFAERIRFHARGGTLGPEEEEEHTWEGLCVDIGKAILAIGEDVRDYLEYLVEFIYDKLSHIPQKIREEFQNTALNIYWKLELSKRDPFGIWDIDDQARAAARLLHSKPNARIVVAGHTHAPKFIRLEYADTASLLPAWSNQIVQTRKRLSAPGYYLNSGSWTDILDVPNRKEDLIQWRQDLLGTEDQWKKWVTPQATFVRMCPKENGVQACLMKWIPNPNNAKQGQEQAICSEIDQGVESKAFLR